ncbi:hypothetical protein QQF64_012508 [Cirrhinus molitorella]|uniref:Rho-GAP domain-containing protein n=1 Tax=Cirrhinus molitorella TaxID=172907 RepID=A0ABR3LVW6_9TELE
MFLLSHVAAGSHLNLMTSENLSIVFGPTIFHVPLSPMVEEQEQCNALTKHLLDNLIHLLPNMPLQDSGTHEDHTGSEGHWKALKMVRDDGRFDYEETDMTDPGRQWGRESHHKYIGSDEGHCKTMGLVKITLEGTEDDPIAADLRRLRRAGEPQQRSVHTAAPASHNGQDENSPTHNLRCQERNYVFNMRRFL